MKLQPIRTDILNRRHAIAKIIVTNIAVYETFETFVSIHYFINTWS